MAYLDSLGAGEVATRITADMQLVQDGVSEKVALLFNGLGALVGGLVVGFVRSWRLALVLLVIPIGLMVYFGVMGGALRKATVASVTLYAATSSFAEEAISSLRNVTAYGAQKRFARRYEQSLVPAIKAEFRAEALIGVLLGGVFSMLLSLFAFAPWVGSFFYDSGEIGLGAIFTTMFASLVAATSFNAVMPSLQAFAVAGAAANRVLAAVARKPAAEIPEHERKTPESLRGDIEFKDLKLVYPSRKSHLVLDEFTLHIPAGQTTAVVGPSGSGKSSLVYLLQGFYVPLHGHVLIDGTDVRELDLTWLRRNMRMVGQEPFLFNATIFENIAHGLTGTEFENVSRQIAIVLAKARLDHCAERTPRSLIFLRSASLSKMLPQQRTRTTSSSPCHKATRRESAPKAAC
jgi:ATP-binding cassette subfamily B (MDR/TAP) protein 1